VKNFILLDAFEKYYVESSRGNSEANDLRSTDDENIISRR
jgi:hypothetical protein